MSEHTAEPWICRIDETVTIRDSQDNQLGILTHLHTRTGGRRDADEVAANARRIVACVNACKDVDNETLEKISSGDMDGSEIVELAKVKKPIDELPDSALHAAAQCWCDPETSGIEMDVRLATAFAKGLAALESRLEAAEAEKQRAIDAALESARLELKELLDARTADLFSSARPEHRSGEINGLRKAILRLDARIGENPLADALARIAALEQRLAEATKFIQDIADGGGFIGAAAKYFLESTHD